MSDVNVGEAGIPLQATPNSMSELGQLVMTQCRQAVDILRDADAGRPITLRDFKLSLDKSLEALSVSFH